MEQFIIENILIIVVLGLWSLVWTGLALWKSARLNKKWWFIVILLINSLGFLEILYLFVFSKEQNNIEKNEVSDNQETI